MCILGNLLDLYRKGLNHRCTLVKKAGLSFFTSISEDRFPLLSRRRPQAAALIASSDRYVGRQSLRRRKVSASSHGYSSTVTSEASGAP